MSHKLIQVKSKIKPRTNEDSEHDKMFSQINFLITNTDWNFKFQIFSIFFAVIWNSFIILNIQYVFKTIEISLIL